MEFTIKVYRENGHSVVICVIRDITDRKRIQKYKYFLAAIVESLEDSVVTVDFDAIINIGTKGRSVSTAIGQKMSSGSP